MDKAKEILEKKQIRPSYQRLKILNYLMSHRTHPTVEMIYANLKKEMPTISKTTVYNTLKALVHEGLADGLTINPEETHYDYKWDNHSHFLCKKCKQIIDLDNHELICKVKEVAGNKVEEAHHYFKGICKNCNNKGGNKNGKR